jgi:hypothetical protein
MGVTPRIGVKALIFLEKVGMESMRIAYGFRMAPAVPEA